MSATDQLIVALATLIITIASLLPAALTVWSHLVQGRQLDRIDTSTNGTMTAMRGELASVRAELAALREAKPS